MENAVRKLPPELAARAAAGTLSHAYILAGPDGDQVEALGRALAAAMVCTGGPDKPCGGCRHCRKAAEDIHPDIIHIRAQEGKQDLSVDQARDLRADAYVTPNEGARKVYLIHETQRMNVNAQNALLKVLEEGPRYAAFLLLCDNPWVMLPTIRSRCETVSLGGSVPVEDGLEEQAQELCRLMLAGDGWAMVRRCVPLEKGKREETVALWEAMRRALIPMTTGKNGRKAAHLLEGLGEVLRQADMNVNLGALWGRLYALAG